MIFTCGEGSLRPGQKNGGLTDEEQELTKVLMLNVNDLGLSVRAVNCLSSANIQCLGDLVEKSDSQMLKFRNFGKKSLAEIKEMLKGLGLSLETVLKDSIKEELTRQKALRLQNNEE